MAFKVCKNCRKWFFTSARTTAHSNEWTEEQMLYCSGECARSAQNRRNYNRRKEEKSDDGKTE